MLERPREELEAIEIPVAGLDCKGCAFGAYKAVIEIEGVEQATASFKLGLIRAWIDPARTNRPALEDALRRRQVEVLSGETPAP